jgi:DNA-binding PadR family transcriptional regulator
MCARDPARLTIPDLVVLTLLAEGPKHGYQLNQELVERDVKDWAGVSRPQVYYSLHKLADAGLVRAAGDPDPAAGPERQVYRTTAAGLRALAAALDDDRWATQRPPPPFMTWLALAEHATPEARARVIATRRAFLDRELGRERATLVDLRRDRSGAAMVIAARLMVSQTIAQLELERRWLDEVERELAP